MTPTLLSEKARELLADRWRLTPARMAEHLTNGRFKRYAHVRFLERKIAEAVGRGGARLLITMPPRHGKSWLGSLYTPAWFLSLWPKRHVILASYDQSVAQSWVRCTREVLTGIGVRGGTMTGVGVGGAVAGPGGDLLIVDDPLKGWKAAASESVLRGQLEWFNSTLRVRAADAKASIIVLMTRWHERDLAGCLASGDAEKWEVLRVPALAEHDDPLGRKPGEPLCEERFDLAALERLRSVVGTRAWRALYQQAPEPEGGRLLRRDWWRFYSTPPAAFDEIVQSWDMAFKDGDTSDFVVGQVWGRVGSEKFLLDQVRGRMDFPATLEAVRELSLRHPRATRKIVEAKANGPAVVAVLRDSVPGLELVEPRGGKVARVNVISGQVEAGEVLLPAPALAPWVEEFVAESTDFPNGRHDDQVDAMAQALTALGNLNNGGY